MWLFVFRIAVNKTRYRKLHCKEVERGVTRRKFYRIIDLFNCYFQLNIRLYKQNKNGVAIIRYAISVTMNYSASEPLSVSVEDSSVASAVPSVTSVFSAVSVASEFSSVVSSAVSPFILSLLLISGLS